MTVDPSGPGGYHYLAETTDIEKTSQIVSHSLYVVERLGEVTDALGISSYSSIKEGAIRGSANSCIVDTNRFKQSDINYLFQVKVTNQTKMTRDVLRFNPLDNLHASRFTKIFGDTFISGFVEGGELNAVISVRVLDKSKLALVKDMIPANATWRGVAPSLSALERLDVERGIELTMSVFWYGGGLIASPAGQWNVKSLGTIAADFPSLAASVPQRTL